MAFDALIAQLSILSRVRLYGPVLLIAVLVYALLARVPPFRSLPRGVSMAGRAALAILTGLVVRVLAFGFLGR